MRITLLAPCLVLIAAIAMMTQGQESSAIQDILEEHTIVKTTQDEMKSQYEAELKAIQDRIAAFNASQSDRETAAGDAEEGLQAALQNFGQQIQVISAAAMIGGSSYAHWGRATCPEGAALVYSGFMGGKFSNQVGSGHNALCLPSQPQYDNTTTPRQFGIVAGAEYKGIADLLNQDVPCSVCLAQQSTTIMVPARLTCPPGWTAQYSGHLVSALTTAQGTEYLCLDASPEGDPEDERPVFKNGYVLYYVLSKCGSLPCPPYENDRVVTCVVCSK